MRLFRYRSNGTAKYGSLVKDRLVSFEDLARERKTKVPQQLSDLLAMGITESSRLAQNLIRDSPNEDLDACSTSLSEATIMAPIPFPTKIICLGLNYRDHIEETGQEVPDEPVIFMKPHTAIIGPNENIVKPNSVKELDYEGELAIIIGRKVKKVSEKRARDCIFGYTIMNDVSARDIQFKDRQWTRGKSFDTFAPTGPCIVTQEELTDTSHLSIRTWVNEQLRQDSSTAKMVFNVEQIVSCLSKVMTLEPSDIIATGTPSGVGFKMKPQPEFLQAGDIVKIEIEGIGILQNSVVSEKEASYLA